MTKLSGFALLLFVSFGMCGCIGTIARVTPAIHVTCRVLERGTERPIQGARIFASLPGTWGGKNYGPFVADTDGNVVVDISPEQVRVKEADVFYGDVPPTPWFTCEADGYEFGGNILGERSEQAVKTGTIGVWHLRKKAEASK